jgi:Uma2 family endonuclease
MTIKTEVTIEALYRVPGKAEIVSGEIVLMSPTGGWPGCAGDRIYTSLSEYEQRVGTGWAVGDNKPFRVNLPHRKSFSPDAAFYVGPDPGVRFFDGAPVFAAVVRNEGDYDAGAEEKIAANRADYFAAGTLVVWDVDLLSAGPVRVYRASDPDQPTIYRRGEIAEAESALPAWRMPVDALFRKPAQAGGAPSSPQASS